MSRESWGSRIGFILAALGSAIGLGNIWRYSYVVYENGGAAFLIPYWVAVFAVGIPLLILEFSLGHRLKASAPRAIEQIHPKWSWLGWWMVLFVMFGIVLYYAVVLSWVFNYWIGSLFLPWEKFPGGIEKYFFNNLLQLSRLDPATGLFPLGGFSLRVLIGLVFVWFVNWYIVYRGVEKGVELANKIFIPLLFLMVVILVFWTISLPGASEGLKFYLKPDWSKLADPGVWIAAVSQIFFSLSLGFGIMIAYASYLAGEEHDIVKYSFLTALGNGVFSFIAGLAVFSTLGYMAYKQGVAVSEVVSSGIGLAFVAYPKAISLLGAGVAKRIFSFVFFTALLVAGISSSISILEAFTSAYLDAFHKGKTLEERSRERKRFVTFLVVLGFVGSSLFATRGGFYLLDIFDHFINNYGLVTAGLLESLLVGYVFKVVIMKSLKRFREHIEVFSKYASFIEEFHVGQIWDFLYTVVIPPILSYLLFSAFLKDILTRYSGYSLRVLLIPPVYLVLLVIVAVYLAKKQREVENL